MKAIKFATLLAVVLAITVGSTGCRKRPTPITPIDSHKAIVRDNGMNGLNGGQGIGNPGEGVTGTPVGGTPQSGMFDESNSTPDRAALAAHTVHFAYDSIVIKASDKGNVQAAADYMKAHPAFGLLVEGHCDERGTEEYNDSLGERRATAIREALIADGVSADHVITRTYGEKQPVDSGHDESAWSQNRRGVFVVLQPK